MGLLDSLLGQVAGQMLGGTQQPQGGTADLGGMADVLGGLLADNGQHGGLGGLMTKFEQAGLGGAMNSWIGTGQNESVSGDQLHQALGDDVVSGLSSKLGMNASTLLPLLVTMLPTIIDKLTPDGKVPAQGVGNQNDLLASLSNILRG